jgi:hypothetical protein
MALPRRSTEPKVRGSNPLGRAAERALDSQILNEVRRHGTPGGNEVGPAPSLGRRMHTDRRTTVVWSPVSEPVALSPRCSVARCAIPARAAARSRGQLWLAGSILRRRMSASLGARSGTAPRLLDCMIGHTRGVAGRRQRHRFRPTRSRCELQPTRRLLVRSGRPTHGLGDVRLSGRKEECVARGSLSRVTALGPSRTTSGSGTGP